ncbi:MAG: hypothetical protein LBS64_04305 [Spirochaetaceae bacterium]|jgi:3-hydroxybutyryl-CoA dehydrogenase|nr:hypothetical protein [Spirochaetaceae bacterium]
MNTVHIENVPENFRTVVVVGSGLMGSGIAARAALAGNRTIIVNRHVEHAQEGWEKARENLRELADNGLADNEAADKGAALLSFTGDMEAALKNARFVMEAVPENLALKQALFTQMDAALPQEVPIVSTTSGIRITEISARTRHPERTCTGHFWFPPHIVPLVEVVIGDRTDPAVAQAAFDEFKAWGKEPVMVKKDLPGQLGNRILHAMIREAVNIVAIGLASAEDVDRCIKLGMGIRFPVYGPLEHSDAVGIDLTSAVQDIVLPAISGIDHTNDYMKAMLERGDLGCKTGKGFYDWSPRSMADLAARRNDFIMSTVKKLYGKR